VLRHGFKPAELEKLAGPWAPLILVKPIPPQARRQSS
jgi:hypothetical protein